MKYFGYWVGAGLWCRWVALSRNSSVCSAASCSRCWGAFLFQSLAIKPHHSFVVARESSAACAIPHHLHPSVSKSRASHSSPHTNRRCLAGELGGCGTALTIKQSKQMQLLQQTLLHRWTPASAWVCPCDPSLCIPWQGLEDVSSVRNCGSGLLEQTHSISSGGCAGPCLFTCSSMLLEAKAGMC